MADQDIVNRYTQALIYRSETAATRDGAIVEAVAKRISLYEANLDRANLDRANLVGANLVGANLVGANLVGANLVGANLVGANLVGANLDRANLVGASLDGANLVGASLDRANLDRANLDGASLDGANLVGASLDRANLVGASLDRANLDRANLDRANLDGANLDRANLDGASLDGANLVGASLDRASLDRANLDRANLDRANLDRANLDRIREDFFEVLASAPAEACGLLVALRLGKIDGSTYDDGVCHCLVGTLADVGGHMYDQIPGLAPESSRAAERWFLALKPGHTPSNNQVATITEGWILQWLKEHRPAAIAVVAADDAFAVALAELSEKRQACASANNAAGLAALTASLQD